MFKSLAALTLFALSALAQQGQLTVDEPSADHWWVAESLNTLRWSSQSGAPTQFSVFLNNPDPTVLTSKYALISVQQLYEYSKTINPGKMKPATGYTVELTDILNSTNVYASSESFEIKAVGASYPSQTTPSASGSVVAVSGAAASGAGASSAPSASSSGVAWPNATPGMIGAGLVGGLGLLL